MDGPESLWLALALGWRRGLDFSSEAGLLEMQVSAFLPGSPAEEAAERFAAERDVGIGLELARLLRAECEGCEDERRAKLADLASSPSCSAPASETAGRRPRSRGTCAGSRMPGSSVTVSPRPS
jgi:hypothetical protein